MTAEIGKEIISSGLINVVALDDHHSKLIKDLLKEYKEHYDSVDSVSTTQDFYDVLKTYKKEGKHCHVIILDHILVKRFDNSTTYENGLDVYNKLQEDADFRNIPIVLYSGLEPSDDGDMKELIKKNNVYYLLKDGSGESLHNKVVEALNNIK